MSRREGDDRLALIGGFVFMLILSWFPPLGVIIAGFLIGIISTKTREGAVIGAILAAVGALIQITFISTVIPVISSVIQVTGLLSTFGPLSDVFVTFGSYIAGQNFGGDLALFSLYCIEGALGGFLGGLVR